MQRAPEAVIEIGPVDYLIEFCLNEIALQGLEGCRLIDLFPRLQKSAQTSQSQLGSGNDSDNDWLRLSRLFSDLTSSGSDSQQQDRDRGRNFIWRLLLNQFELDFYIEQASSQSSSSSSTADQSKKSSKPSSSALRSLVASRTAHTKLAHLVSHNQTRGFCATYFQRKNVNGELRSQFGNNNTRTYQACLDEFGSSLVLVGSQPLRHKVLAPSHKCIELESLNDLEYCVLERIGRSRYEGVCSIGADGLTSQFQLAPKQLHYVLGVLEAGELTRKQVLASSAEKKRSLVHLTRFASKRQSTLELLCAHLLFQRQVKQTGHCADSALNIRRKFGLTPKQLKSLVQQAERARILRRFVQAQPPPPPPPPPQTEKATVGGKMKPISVRMIALTDSHYASMTDQQEGAVEEEEEEEEEEGEDGDEHDTTLGVEQSLLQPMHSQLLARIERCAAEGVSLRQLGALFGLDFYKARRMGSNLQMHPDIVTIIKETNRGKAKYQTIMLRKFVTAAVKSSNSSPSSSSLEPIAIEQHTPEIMTPEVVCLKRDTASLAASSSIQALMSTRMLARKQLILAYVAENRLCTKYEINREIRTREAAQGLSGCIDSKTTKRMLQALANERALLLFEIQVKNVSYMCVRAIDIAETDEAYLAYCHTFRRTFDPDMASKKSNETTNAARAQNTDETNKPAKPQTTNPAENNNESFNLTRQYIQSIVSSMPYSTNYAKNYSLVPKVQKAIVLYRFIHYLLFCYDGQPQQSTITSSSHTGFDSSSPSPASLPLPSRERTYQGQTCWQMYIPPLSPRNSSSSSSSSSSLVFIGELLSHMPLSVFCATIVINYQVPGLLDLLSHPRLRHMLVRDLPAQMLAPLIAERRYVRRMLANLQFLAALGLCAFVEAPCKANEALNRDSHSQAVHVYRRAAFFDTADNACTSWPEFLARSAQAFSSKAEQPTNSYPRLTFELHSDSDVVEFWRRLVHTCMGTYKFGVGAHLKENKQLRKRLHSFLTRKHKPNELGEMFELEKEPALDHLGPGGYDSQLFLHYAQNWVMPTAAKSGGGGGQSSKAITKDSDKSHAPYSELALFFPFSLFRGLASAANNKTASNRKETMSSSSETTAPPAAKRLRRAASSVMKSTDARSLKLLKAKSLVDRATKLKTAVSLKPVAADRAAAAERRAVWHTDEDELILLIKVASLYLMPGERCIPFKLISDVLLELVEDSGKRNADKSVSSVGRRVKVLMKMRINKLFVLNKYQLCRQDKWLESRYAKGNKLLRRNVIDKECVNMYVRFIRDVIQRHMKKESGDGGDVEEERVKFELPDTMNEFRAKYTVKNATVDGRDLLIKSSASFFQQPTSDYEITSNTLHSAIHSSILINDKNPRVFESFHLFDRYSEQLLSDVVARMSRDHRIIAPTKYAELKRKRVVAAFSKHVGSKAYHISQRYQYKWMNNISPAILNETSTFKQKLVEFSHGNSQANMSDAMFDCTDKDDLGMTSFLAHTIDNSDIQVQIDVPNKIWVSKYI